MMSLKFSRIAKVTRDLTGRRPANPPADDDFEVYLLILQSYHLLTPPQHCCIIEYCLCYRKRNI